MSAHATSPDLAEVSTRGPFRLRMSVRPGLDRLDGGWWPYTRDLDTELAELVQKFPPIHGRIMRAVYSRPDWDTAPRRISLASREIKVGSSPDGDTHVIVVETTNQQRFTLLVIPPSFTPGQGAEALLASATKGNSHSGAELLREVTDQHDADPHDVWGRDEDGTPRQAPAQRRPLRTGDHG